MTTFELIAYMFNNYSDYTVVVNETGFEVYGEDHELLENYLAADDHDHYDRIQHWIHKALTWAELEAILLETGDEEDSGELYDDIASIINPIIYNMKYR